MPDSDICVVCPQDVVAVWGAVHPPIEYVLRRNIPTFVNVFSPPGWVIPVGGDPDIAGGPVRAGMGDEAVAGHVDAVFAGRGAEAAVHPQGPKSGVCSGLVYEG